MGAKEDLFKAIWASDLTKFQAVIKAHPDLPVERLVGKKGNVLQTIIYTGPENTAMLEWYLSHPGVDANRVSTIESDRGDKNEISDLKEIITDDSAFVFAMILASCGTMPIFWLMLGMLSGDSIYYGIKDEITNAGMFVDDVHNGEEDRYFVANKTHPINLIMNVQDARYANMINLLLKSPTLDSRKFYEFSPKYLNTAFMNNIRQDIQAYINPETMQTALLSKLMSSRYLRYVMSKVIKSDMPESHSRIRAVISLLEAKEDLITASTLRKPAQIKQMREEVLANLNKTLQFDPEVLIKFIEGIVTEKYDNPFNMQLWHLFVDILDTLIKQDKHDKTMLAKGQDKEMAELILSKHEAFKHDLHYEQLLNYKHPQSVQIDLSANAYERNLKALESLNKKSLNTADVDVIQEKAIQVLNSYIAKCHNEHVKSKKSIFSSAPVEKRLLAALALKTAIEQGADLTQLKANYPELNPSSLRNKLTDDLPKIFASIESSIKYVTEHGYNPSPHIGDAEL